MDETHRHRTITRPYHSGSLGSPTNDTIRLRKIGPANVSASCTSFKMPASAKCQPKVAIKVHMVWLVARVLCTAHLSSKRSLMTREAS